MPRNPNKRRCQTPGCKAYAMRTLGGGARSRPGQSSIGPSRDVVPANHCRSHLDHVLGPRRVGAPKGNRGQSLIGPSWSLLQPNALKTGRHAHPVSVHKLDLLAHEIAKEPSQTPAILSRELYALQDRTGDAYLTLILASRLARQLLPKVTDQIFHIELYHLLQNFGPASRPKVEAAIRHETLPLNPLKRLTALRDADKYLKSIINNPDNER